MKIINKEILDQLSVEAVSSPRLRKNLNYHEELSDPLQRLLNAMEPNTYVQPHKHETPDKREFFTILRGKALVVLFNDSGEITNHCVLSVKDEVLGIEIPAKIWHTVIIIEKNTVLFEVKDGPYAALDDKDFAPWAPKEGDENCMAYNQTILKKLGY